MNLYNRRIGHRIFHIGLTGQGIKNPSENIGITPLAEATVDL
ncbi:hypothetical protein GGR01_002617 [Acetobacter oeni]|nr:hypothetical protein [Acetobacter oeni]